RNGLDASEEAALLDDELAVVRLGESERHGSSVGCGDASHEVIDPRDCLLDGRQNIYVLCGSRVEGAPPLAHDDVRRPGLLPPVAEETDARRRDLVEVEILPIVEQLKIYQVVSTFTSLGGDRVELLRNLVVCAHDPHRPRSC